MPDDTVRSLILLLASRSTSVTRRACCLSFADLHPRRQAENALRHSEERFAKAFRMAPVPMAIIALNGLRMLDVNDAFTAVTGWRREEVVGRSEPDLGVVGEQVEREKRLSSRSRKTGHIHSADIQLRNKDGETGDYLLSAETVMIHQEQCVLTVMLDITERKQTENQLLAAIKSVMQDTSWFGQKIVEKLASLTRSDAIRSGARDDQPDAGRVKCSVLWRRACPTRRLRRGWG